MARAEIVEALEAQPTLRHITWNAVTVLSPQTGLENGGEKWGEQEEGKREEDSKASSFFAVAIQTDVRELDTAVSPSGGAALVMTTVTTVRHLQWVGLP